MKIIAFKIFIASFVLACVLGFTLLQTKVPDVEAIYAEYFEKYHLGESAKNELLTELKLLVNYIHYEKEHGHDYVNIMKTLDYYAKFKGQEPLFEAEILSIKDLSHYEGQTTTFPSQNSHMCTEFSNFVQNQKSLVAQYRLPYTVAQSSLQLIDMEEFLLIKERLHESKKIEYSLEQNNIISEKINQLKAFNWKSGSILLAHKKPAHESIQGYYNHIGIYSQKCKCIIDAIPPNGHFSGGVRESDWSYWAENFSDFAILSLDKLSDLQAKRIESYVLAKLHEPYSVSTYKKNEKSGWYCSKLVYLAYLQAGIDLDTKKGVSILPDDIALGQNFDTSVCMGFSE